MRKGLLFVMFAFLACNAIAQDIRAGNVRYYPGKVKYQKVEHDATIFDMPYPKEQVEDGLRKLAESRGVKAREHSGFLEAKNIKVQKLNGKACDVYFKVEKEGKSASKVYMIMAEPGEDLNNRNTSHTALLAAAGGAGVVAAVGSHLDDHNNDELVKSQEKDIKDMEKKYNSLLEEQKRLDKKFTDLQADIEKNKTEQTRMQQEIESRKAALEVFKQGKGKGKVEVPK
ncbi:MAG: coiled-coil domain-containing protein [Sphingobacteriales bacterium]